MLDHGSSASETGRYFAADPCRCSAARQRRLGSAGSNLAPHSMPFVSETKVNARGRPACVNCRNRHRRASLAATVSVGQARSSWSVVQSRSLTVMPSRSDRWPGRGRSRPPAVASSPESWRIGRLAGVKATLSNNCTDRLGVNQDEGEDRRLRALGDPGVHRAALHADVARLHRHRAAVVEFEVAFAREADRVVEGSRCGA